ncbi:hypothetical protein [Rhodovulum marinum]|uniref:Uncharacterized protein n=1 Tax=Rhodovulum marinum TaxID=320662 RepID=A0A4R2Q5S1_9RHOB|nr:hypothetical protein [Rhodovulum marinum]TCP44152.1 hypothetical protein EV662_101240 [Rhodovulum marinum]
MDDANPDDMTPWARLSPAGRLRLRETHAADPACLAGTCSLEAKTRHFTAWLADRGVAFSADDLHPTRLIAAAGPAHPTC